MIKRIIPIMLLSCLLGGCVTNNTPLPPDDGHTEPGEGEELPPEEEMVTILDDLTGSFNAGTELSHDNNYDKFIAHLNKKDEGLVKSGYFRNVYAQTDGLDNHIFTTIGTGSKEGTFRITFEKTVKEVNLVLASFYKSYGSSTNPTHNTYTAWFEVNAGGTRTTGYLRPNETATGPLLNEIKLSMAEGNYIEVMGEMDKAGATDYRVVIRSLSVSY